MRNVVEDVLSWSSNADRAQPPTGRASSVDEQPPSEILPAVDAAAAVLEELSDVGIELRVVVVVGDSRVWIELSRDGRPAGKLSASRALDLLACGAVGERLAAGGRGSPRPR